MRFGVEERPFIEKKNCKIEQSVGGSSDMRVCVEERPFIKTVKVIGWSAGRRTCALGLKKDHLEKL